MTENNEIFENENVEFVEATVVEENDETGVNPIIIAAAAVGVGLVGLGVAGVKKYGGKAKARINDARETRLIKKQEKLDKKFIKIEEKKTLVIPEKESEEE